MTRVFPKNTVDGKVFVICYPPPPFEFMSADIHTEPDVLFYDQPSLVLYKSQRGETFTLTQMFPGAISWHHRLRKMAKHFLSSF